MQISIDELEQLVKDLLLENHFLRKRIAELEESVS